MTVARPASFASARRSAAARLAAAGADSPALDARLLLEAATGLEAAALAASPERALTTDEDSRFETLLLRRIGREPMAQILGRAAFWTLDFVVTPDVLAPRPETESVLEAALAETRDQPMGRVMDLGVGPGTLLLAFLAERPGWSGVGVDLSEPALRVARGNARALGLADRTAFLAADWDAALSPMRGFHLLLSNPPYIASGEIAGLAPEVRDHEPRLALDGGPDGLDAYRRIAPSLPRLLAPGGVAVLETGAPDRSAGPALDAGPGQARQVAALVREVIEAADASPGGAAVRIVRDLGDRERAVVVRLPG